MVRNGRPFSFSLTEVDFAHVDPSGARRLDIGGVAFRASASRRPDTPGHVTVSSPDHEVLTDGSGHAFDRMDLAVHNSWVALVSDRQSDAVDVLVLMDALAPSEAYEAVAVRVRRELPGRLAQLREMPPPAGDVEGTPVSVGAPGRDDLEAEPWAAPEKAPAKSRLSRKKSRETEDDWDRW